jgi:CRP-like cAMP-binding protein
MAGGRLAFKPLLVACKLRASVRMIAARLPGERPKNRLLAGLPDPDFQRLRPRLTTMPLRSRQVLQKQGERIQQVYFPNAGILSMATVLSDGAVVEAAAIGDEGMAGVAAFLNRDAVSPCDVTVQVPVPAGSAEMLPEAEFRHEIDRHGALYERVARYTEIVCAEITRLTACNVRHEVNERCARRLLAAQDQVHADDFYLSQESLAMMLGVRRQTVSVVASTFQSAGLIRYVHGHITIVNRRGLEAAACECYAAIAALYSRLR